MSKDSLRKHVSTVFGKGTASHSLRKGGAVFYSRRGMDDDATRQQGGWKTSEVMQRIYATLTKDEVCEQIVAVGRATSVHHEIQLRVLRLGDDPEKARSASASSAWAFLTLLQNNLKVLNTRVLYDTNAPKYLRVLSRHADEDVRNMAISLHTAIHANWMSAQASKRRRLQ